MPVMYRSEMIESAIYNDLGYVVVRYGAVPTKFDVNEIECNLLVVQKKYLCGYHTFSNLDYSNWGLLEVGLYRDSLSKSELKTVQREISKTISFTIPFERNMVDFDKERIQALYDSLLITD